MSPFRSFAERDEHFAKFERPEPPKPLTARVLPKFDWLSTRDAGTTHLIDHYGETAMTWDEQGSARTTVRIRCGGFMEGRLVLKDQVDPGQLCVECILYRTSSYHYVYRLFGGDGLVYIGCTKSIPRRFNQHRVQSNWWPQVDRFTCEYFGTPDAAADAEAHLINTLRPPANDWRARRYPAGTSQPGGEAGPLGTFAERIAPLMGHPAVYHSASWVA